MVGSTVNADDGLSSGASYGHVNIEGPDPGISFDAADTGWCGDGEDLALGIGARFNSGSALGMRAEFEWFDIDDADAVWIASAGILFRF